MSEDSIQINAVEEEEGSMSFRLATQIFQRFPDRFLVFVYGTLKRGQPNYPVMANLLNGKSDFICRAKTVDKYPLVIGSRYNVPYLIAQRGTGHRIEGEVFAVDRQMLEFLDDFEGHPNYYQRNQMKTIAVDDNDKVLGELKPWIYMIEKYKPEMLKLEKYSCYDSFGAHGLRYVESDPTHGMAD